MDSKEKFHSSPLSSLSSFSSLPSSNSFSSSTQQTITIPPLNSSVSIATNSEILKLLEETCIYLDKDIILQEKVRTFKENVTELSRSKSCSTFEETQIQKDLQRDLYNCIFNAYQVRQNEFSHYIAKKCLQPETITMLCENQQRLYQLLAQYRKLLN